jgi:hypothetical protein
MPRQNEPRDLLARILLVVSALGAIGSIWAAADAVGKADQALQVTAVHDVASFPVYAALFLLLAWRPRGLPGVWEILIAQKAIVGLVLVIGYREADGAIFTGTVDIVLTIILAAAYVAAQGWRAWSSR